MWAIGSGRAPSWISLAAGWMSWGQRALLLHAFPVAARPSVLIRCALPTVLRSPSIPSELAWKCLRGMHTQGDPKGCGRAGRLWEGGCVPNCPGTGARHWGQVLIALPTIAHQSMPSCLVPFCLPKPQVTDSLMPLLLSGVLLLPSPTTYYPSSHR